jgi:hypothetical protein
MQLSARKAAGSAIECSLPIRAVAWARCWRYGHRHRVPRGTGTRRRRARARIRALGRTGLKNPCGRIGSLVAVLSQCRYASCDTPIDSVLSSYSNARTHSVAPFLPPPDSSEALVHASVAHAAFSNTGKRFAAFPHAGLVWPIARRSTRGPDPARRLHLSSRCFN